MHFSRQTFICSLFIIGFLISNPVQAQLGFDLDIKKPEPYENRELTAEKTPDKKIKAPRKFFQNTFTHYNYFFNANTKLNEIIGRAKLAHKDDYANLLTFYNYSLETTAQDADQLDSVMYKSKTGIVLHDLRNDWVDNLYLLWGASYYLKQQFDSAHQMFQFINYAFAEKEKDGYYKYIGSKMDGNNATSISTKENSSKAKSLISEPPSRNDALVWQIRTLIQQEAYIEAGSLITTLKNDPLFPKRLHNTLEEIQAYWFYRQGIWDSSAVHLVNALDVAKNKQEKARWEYLAAQMFERSGRFEEAEKNYTKAIAHTTDPVMDIYARLNLIRINKDGGDNYIDKNIAQLLKMAKRDKFSDYRDVIYSMAAQMELERGNFAAAQAHLLKASKYKSDNPVANNRAYLQLADLSFERGEYKQAAAFYDSVKVQNLATEDADRITKRKEVLGRLLPHLGIIERQDSLQRIAALPEAEREDVVRRVVRQLRKEQGLKDEGSTSGSGRSASATTKTPPDLFSTQQAKGEWYFYNPVLKSSGATTFKQTWGNRPNVDNWRRYSNVTAQLRSDLPNVTRNVPVTTEEDLSPNFDALFSKLPLSAEAMILSNDSIVRALAALGGIYINDLENYPSAIGAYEQIRSRLAQNEITEDVLFNLYYGYTKAGDAVKAAEIKKILLERYPNSRYSTILSTGKDPQAATPSNQATKTYEDIYDKFIEGKFEEAKQQKRVADSLYKTNYWSPQLLYIEAVYHIRQREDSVAKTVLTTLIQQNGGTPIASKAENLLQVLGRRNEIEEELRKLEVERPVEDTLYVEPMPVAASVKKQDAVNTKPKDSVAITKPIITKAPVSDTTFKRSAPVKSNSLYNFNPNVQHYAVVVLKKVDVVFGNETRNAFNRYNREKYYNQPLQNELVNLTDDIKLLVIRNFENAQAAIDYVQKAKPIAATQIIPWLKGDKYSFSIISADNLKALTDTKDFNAYAQFLEQNLPVKL